jgi:signal transduction histidine kinase
MTGMLITSVVGLVVAGTSFFVYEYLAFKKSLVYQTTIMGQMCAANTTAALAFRDSADAQDILSSLNVAPNVVLAVLYDRNDSVFARYPAHADVKSSGLLRRGEGFHFRHSMLEVSIPVVHDGNRLGTLYLVSSMEIFYQRYSLYTLIGLVVIGFSFIVSYSLSRTLQQSISGPIVSLARTAEIISKKKDYTVRATKHDEDEIGALTDAFNTMLSEIEKQNHEILAFNQDLEGKVHIRTQELKIAYDEMESFSYTVSHDLNAPLRKIDTYIDRYMSKPDAAIDEPGKDMLEKVTNNVRRMRQLIADLLAFAQLGKHELEKTDVNMKELARSVFEDCQRLEGERTIEFHLCDLPPAFVDGGTMTHVWTNLISNALKYTKYNEVTKIAICFEKRHDCTVYYVKDNGVGFDMEHYGKLFSAFNRLHAQKDFEGTGVGLAIVHRILAKHGGSVWAESVPQKGSTFYFSIPDQVNAG